MIYRGGFFTGADKQKMTSIRTMNPAQLARIQPTFDDPRLAEMLFRYRARNWPESLEPEEQTRWEQFRQQRLTEKTKAGGTVLEEYEHRLAELEAVADTPVRIQEILAQLRSWGRSLVAASSP
jgi:exodeoxyribonuclease-1